MRQTNQNIPKGYKKTEVGIIPEDWEVMKIGNLLVDSFLGGNYKNDLNPKEKQIPLIKMGNLRRGRISVDTVYGILDNEKLDDKHLLSFDDVLFNTRNTLDLVGKVAIWKNEYPIAYFNSNLLKLIFDNQLIKNNDFINYLLNSYLALRNLRAVATGTTSVAAIYDRDIKKIKLPIPPLEEQEEIANCLTAWDKAISQSKKLIEAKKQVKKGLMQQLLTGKKRLDGFTDEWKEVRLGEVLKERNENKKNHLRVITSSRKGLYYQEDYFKKIVASKSLDNYKLLKMGDFTFRSMSDDGYFFFNRMNFDKPGIVSPAYSVFYCTNVIPNFFYYFINNNHFNKYLQGIVQGGTRLALKFNALKKLKVTLPSIEEQSAIAEILQAADKEIELLELKLKALELQKKGLMQVLLTGKKRLNK